MSVIERAKPRVMAGKAILTDVSSCAAAVPRPIMVTWHGLVRSRAAKEWGGGIALLFSEPVVRRRDRKQCADGDENGRCRKNGERRTGDVGQQAQSRRPEHIAGIRRHPVCG